MAPAAVTRVGVGGSRTLTQTTLLNRIFSVAVGSLVGSAALRPTTPITATVIGAGIIMGAALLVDVAYAYKLLPASWVHPGPVLVYVDGVMQQHQLHRCLLTPDKVASEVRSRGYSSLAKVYAVVLEPSGSFSVISQGEAGGKTGGKIGVKIGVKIDAARDGLELLHDVRGFSDHMRLDAQRQAEATAAGRIGAAAAARPLPVHNSPAGWSEEQHNKPFGPDGRTVTPLTQIHAV
uniref:YetF C-terminal domain-containing protein n=1 Tax=Tetradesmus obliquus TaxID=3088 RepID=A0A383VYK1_TETOB|eukprot:jgi/Sobl393_1/4035/SZX69902.1